LHLLFDRGNQHVGAHGRPDLGLHGVLAGAEKVPDAQVSFDQLEKEFDLPTAFVEPSNGGGFQHCVVGQKDECLAPGWIVESDASDVFRIVLGRLVALENITR
jgi:hypothetical protein